VSAVFLDTMCQQMLTCITIYSIFIFLCLFLKNEQYCLKNINSTMIGMVFFLYLTKKIMYVFGLAAKRIDFGRIAFDRIDLV
jgi:hypothetical protein